MFVRIVWLAYSYLKKKLRKYQIMKSIDETKICENKSSQKIHHLPIREIKSMQNIKKVTRENFSP